MQRQRVQVMAVLWSEFLALWFDRTRRRALPLLLATLLLLIPSLPASSDCSCELPGEGSSSAHHHEEGEAHEHKHKHADSPVAATSFTSAPTSHVHLAALSQGGTSQSGTACCSCSRAPLSAASTVVAPPSQQNADSQNLAYVSVNTLSVYRVDCLTGLFGRAGPPPDSKPQLLSLSSLPGRAPPVSI